MKYAGLLLALVACYEPTLEPCTVVCGANDPCPSGLTCGDDLHCHGESEESSCGFTVTIDLVEDQELLGGSGRLVATGTTLSCPGECVVTAIGGTELVIAPELDEDSSALFTFSGDCEGRICKFSTLDRDKFVTATVTKGRQVDLGLKGDGQGGVQSTPEGISCPGRCRAAFALDEVITLVAEPVAPGSFGAWGGLVDCGVELTCEVPAGPTVVKLEALFDINRLVITPFGGDTTGDQIEVFAEGVSQGRFSTTKELLFDPTIPVAIQLIALPADPQSQEFSAWLGLRCSPNDALGTCTFSLGLHEDIVGIGLFERRPTLSIKAGPNGSFTLDPPQPSFVCIDELGGGRQCSGNVKKGTALRIDTFTTDGLEPRWVKCPTQQGPPFEVNCVVPNVDQDLPIAVTFEPPPALSVSVLTNQATVTAGGQPQAQCAAFADCGYSFPLGTVVTVNHLGATPGNVWAGMNTCQVVGQPQANPCTFTLLADTILTGF